MPATQTAATCADWGQLILTRSAAGASYTLSILPNAQSLDLLQIFGEGGNCLIQVTSTGVVNANVSNQTGETLFGRYLSRLKSTATVAQIFADAFSQNNAQQDIIQVKAPTSAGVWHLDYLGVAYSA